MEINLQLRKADPQNGPINSKAIDEKLSLMIARDNQSPSLVSEKGFIGLTKALCPQYKMKTASYYENMICNDIYQRLLTKMKQELNMLDSFSIATSICRDPNGQGILSLCLHGISSDFKAKKFHLKCEALLDECSSDEIECQIRDIIPKTLLELQLPEEKIHCVVRDEGTLTQDTEIECGVYLLKCIVKNAIDSNEQLKELDSKCQHIFKHFEWSTIAYDNLKRIYEQRLKLELFDELMESMEDYTLEWNSIFRLKAILLKLKSALLIYAEQYNMDMINADQWMDIDLCNRVIQPVEEVVNIWSDSTVSSVIPLIAALRDSLRTDVNNFASSVTVCSFARKLLEQLELKCLKMCSKAKYQIATYLDPRYKQAFFTPIEAQGLTEEVLAELSRIQPEHAWQPLKINPKPNVESESKINSILDSMFFPLESQTQLKNLMYLYNSEPRISRQSDPLTWWKSNPKYTALFPIVKKYLSKPAANFSSELLLCNSSSLLFELQNSEEIMCYENVSKILFVKANFEVLNDES